MKIGKSAGVVLLLAVCILAFAFPAPAQEKKPQLYFVEDYVVKPALVAQFEAGIKELNTSIWAAYNWPWPMETYATEDFHYTFVYPFESLTEVDKAFARFNELIGKYGEQKWDALNKRMGGAAESFKQMTATLYPELSYSPAKPRLKPEEEKFVYWGFCYVMPGREKEFEAVFKEVVALFKAKKVATGFNTFMGGIGTESPMYFYAESGRTVADFFLTAEKTDKILGKEIFDLWNKMLTLMRRYEYKMGIARPDLSYIPVKK
jgi:hypothetical protein